VALGAKSAIVVGAGVAGLSAAIDLAVRGVATTVVERAAGPGGKMRELQLDGRAIDAGPTVLTMRSVFDELFNDADVALERYVALTPARVLARHAWGADQQLDLYPDVERSRQEIAEFAGADEARRFAAFCSEAACIYRTLERPFLRAPRPSVLRLTREVGWRRLADLWRIRPFTSLWRALAGHFRDPRLRQLFGRYATYCGSSPFESPATLMLVAHVEQQGVWFVDGGMHRLALALERLARERGVEFRYGCTARSLTVEAGRATGVTLADDTRLQAQAIVFNGDAQALAAGCLGSTAASAVRRLPPLTRSLSAVTWALVARTRGFALERHNVFFSRDYAREFAELRRGRLPTDPTVYVCAQDRPAADAAQPADERLLCLVNAPAIGDRGEPADAALDHCERRMYAALARCGLTVEATGRHSARTAPPDFDRLFPGTGGALYGSASHGWRASFSRPDSRSRLPGLFLAGGSVHPGPGVPMAALSGRLAAAAVLAAR
jgi:1-hydroxycarotenoid 3,4-desaturase